MLTSNDKGNIAEAAIATEAIKLGIPALKPVAEHGALRLAFDLGDRILRVQCMWARLEGAGDLHQPSRLSPDQRGWGEEQIHSG